MHQPFVCNTFSFIWKHPFVDCIPWLAEIGFDAFEVLLTAPHLWPADCDTAHRRYLVEALRQPMTLGKGLGAVWIDLLVLIGIFLVAVAFAVRFFRWDSRAT